MRQSGIPYRSGPEDTLMHSSYGKSSDAKPCMIGPIHRESLTSIDLPAIAHRAGQRQVIECCMPCKPLRDDVIYMEGARRGAGRAYGIDSSRLPSHSLDAAATLWAEWS